MYGGRAFAVAGPSTYNSPLKRLRDPSNGASVLAVFSKHFSSQNTNVYSSLEALAKMRYINRRFSLHYITDKLVNLNYGYIKAFELKLQATLTAEHL